MPTPSDGGHIEEGGNNEDIGEGNKAIEDVA